MLQVLSWCLVMGNFMGNVGSFIDCNWFITRLDVYGCQSVHEVERWGRGTGFGVIVKLNTCCEVDVWLTVHRSSMWNKKPTRCHLVLYLFLLYNLLNMFRATLCPSSVADDLVVFLPHVV